MRIILASKSPRRKEILENIGLKFEIVVSNADESSVTKNPALLVTELAYKKAIDVYSSLEDKTDTLVIGCDTVVVLGDDILGKPDDKTDAYDMISKLNGKAHTVISGLCLIYNNKVLSDFDSTKVFFDTLTESEIESYINSSEPYDKAGGYAVQGAFSKYIKKIEGCYHNVVGMPVNLLHNMLKELDVL